MVDHVHEVVGTRHFILPYREDYCQNTVHRDQTPYLYFPSLFSVPCIVSRSTVPRASRTRTDSISSVFAGVTVGHIPTFGATDRRELDFRASLCVGLWPT